MCDLGYGDGVHLALDADSAELQLEAAELAEGELHQGKLLAELLVQLLFHVRGPHILDDARLNQRMHKIYRSIYEVFKFIGKFMSS